MVIHGFLLNLQILHFTINLLHDLTNCQLICEVSVSRQKALGVFSFLVVGGRGVWPTRH
jgi:hypothetical protein